MIIEFIIRDIHVFCCNHLEIFNEYAKPRNMRFVVFFFFFPTSLNIFIFKIYFLCPTININVQLPWSKKEKLLYKREYLYDPRAERH